MQASCARQRRGARAELPAQTLHEVCHQALGTGRRVPPTPRALHDTPSRTLLGAGSQAGSHPSVRACEVRGHSSRSMLSHLFPCGGPSCSPHLEPSFLRQEEGRGGALDQFPPPCTGGGGHLEAMLPHVSESLPNGPICQSPGSSRPELGRLAAAHPAL